MSKYTQLPTQKTPLIDFDGNSGKFLIEGRSIPEDSTDFYKPLMEWMEQYMSDPLPSTHININVEYFNTSTSKCFVELFRKLENIKDQSDIRVIWHHEQEDEGMIESAEDFKKVVRIPIELKVREESD